MVFSCRNNATGTRKWTWLRRNSTRTFLLAIMSTKNFSFPRHFWSHQYKFATPHNKSCVRAWNHHTLNSSEDYKVVKTVRTTFTVNFDVLHPLWIMHASWNFVRLLRVSFFLHLMVAFPFVWNMIKPSVSLTVGCFIWYCSEFCSHINESLDVAEEEVRLHCNASLWKQWCRKKME